MIKKYWAILILIVALLVGQAENALAQVTTVGGGTGSTSPSGILIGVTGNLHLQTLKIGTGLTLTGTTLTSTGGGSSTFGTTSIFATTPLQWNTTTATLSILQAGTSQNGYLSSTDWNTFNNKQPAGNYATFGYLFPANATTSALTLGGLTLSNLTGGGTLCLHVNNAGVVSTAAGDCGTSGGSITAVTATYPILSSGGTTPNISTAFGTTTNWGIGTNGFLVTGPTGIPFVAASSTLNLPTSALASSNISQFTNNSGYVTFAWPFTPINATSVATSSGLVISASSTIGNGTQAGGLYISGGATTTGKSFISTGGSIGSPALAISSGGGVYSSGANNISLSNFNSSVTYDGGEFFPSGDNSILLGTVFNRWQVLNVVTASTTNLTLGVLGCSGSNALNTSASGIVSCGTVTGTGSTGIATTSLAATAPITLTVSSGFATFGTSFSTSTFNAFSAENTFTNLFATNASSSNATTTNFAITGAGASNCNGTSALTTNSSGVVGCTAQPQGTVTSVSVASSNGFSGSSSGGATPILTLATTITGLLKGNGTAISAATPGTDYDVFAWPFTPVSYGNATGTLIGFTGGILSVGSTTIVGNATTTGMHAFGSVRIPTLGVAAGQFAAFDPNGVLIGTTTPSGSNSAFSPSANYATATALPSNTYLAGVITAVANGALSVDGANPSVGQRVLVKNESTAANNGLYDVTAAGSAIAAFVLTRDAQYNSSSNIIPGIVTYVISGSTNDDDFWAMTSAAPITVGTTALNYTEVSGGGASVTSVSNSDSTLTISPTTGNVVASLNLSHANVWSALQTFGNATSTLFSTTYGSTTNAFVGSLTIGTTTAGCLNTSSTGVVYAATCSGGGSTFAYPFTPSTFGIAVSATTTPILDYPGFISATSTVGALTATSSLTVFGATSFNAPLIPGSDSLYNIGSASKEWENLFLQDGAQIHFGSVTITGSFASGGISVNGGGTFNALTLSGAATGCATFTTGVLSSTGSSCGSGGSSFGYPFPVLGIGTTTGLLITASSTIGNGTAAGGLTVSGTATTTALVISSLAGASGCLTPTANGTITTTGCSSGGGAAFPFTPTVNFGTTTSATSTPLSLFQGLFASSSLSGGIILSTPTNITNAFSIFNAAGTNVFNIDDTATNPKHGIGTSTPWATLSAVGNGTDPIFAVASSSNTGLPNFEVNSSGQLIFSGNKPTVGTCTGFAAAAGSNDTTGSVTETSGTSCSMNFVPAWPTAPDCFISPASAASTVRVVTTTSLLTITFGTANTGFSYYCVGKQ